MPPHADHHAWETFLARPQIAADPATLRAAHEGKAILLTGAGGSIGSALAMRIAGFSPRRLVLLESCEDNLYQIHSELDRRAAPHLPILGDIADRPLLDAIFTRHRPEIVYHAAAFKHVPLMEENPLAAVRNNALGTWTLTQAAACHGAGRLVMISTDKAVDPQSVMGASKRVAELVLTALGTEKTRMNSVRLGNVLGSQGSVGLLFLEQIRRGGPVTVTHPEVRRYFVTQRETEDLVLTGATLDSPGGVWVPDLGSPLKVLDLAEHLIRHAGLRPGVDIPVAFIGLRPGDKMTENLVSSRETKEKVTGCALQRTRYQNCSRENLGKALENLTEILRRRDLADLLRALARIVPEYQPSAALVELAAASDIKANRA
jgi:FlaA1/EpsC-like NDP-sugar epimerase